MTTNTVRPHALPKSRSTQPITPIMPLVSAQVGETHPATPLQQSATHPRADVVEAPQPDNKLSPLAMAQPKRPRRMTTNTVRPQALPRPQQKQPVTPIMPLAPAQVGETHPATPLREHEPDQPGQAANRPDQPKVAPAVQHPGHPAQVVTPIQPLHAARHIQGSRATVTPIQTALASNLPFVEDEESPPPPPPPPPAEGLSLPALPNLSQAPPQQQQAKVPAVSKLVPADDSIAFGCSECGCKSYDPYSRQARCKKCYHTGESGRPLATALTLIPEAAHTVDKGVRYVYSPA